MTVDAASNTFTAMTGLEGSMPSDDEPQEQDPWERGAREWAAWLETALRRRRLTPSHFADLTEGRISRGTISQWLNARLAPRNAHTVVLVAQYLVESPVAALRAAGHVGIADAMEQFVRETLSADRAARYREDVEMPEPESYEPSFEGVLAAIAGLAERMDRRFAAVNAKIDDVNADIEVLDTLAHVQQRELRELSARFDRHATRMDRRFDRVDAEFGQVRADIAALKTETALVESSVEGVAETVQRHVEDPHAHNAA